MHDIPKTNKITPEQYSLNRDIDNLRLSPDIKAEDLYSARKMGSAEYPDRPGVRVSLDTPIETAESPTTDVKQDLMAVVALGKNTALGIVRGRDTQGGSIYYVSLMNNGYYDPTGNDGRAIFVESLKPGVPTVITREMIERLVIEKEIAQAVSGTHCTLEINDQILTVIDESSLNGTSVFTNMTDHKSRQFRDIYQWSQKSGQTEELIKITQELKRRQLGRFTLNG